LAESTKWTLQFNNNAAKRILHKKLFAFHAICTNTLQIVSNRIITFVNMNVPLVHHYRTLIIITVTTAKA